MPDQKRESNQPPQAPSNRALRLTFSYEGSNVRLVSQQSVEMILPPSHPLAAAENETGFWYTLADQTGRPVYRRVVHNPIRIDREVFSPDPAQTVHRQPVKEVRGSFVLLVPDVPQARTLLLFSHPLERERAAAPARELVRFSLREEKPQ